MSKPYRSTEEGAWARVRELEELNARLKRRITDMIRITETETITPTSSSWP